MTVTPIHNRAQRSWVYRAAKGIDNTVAFGSTMNLSIPGTPIFVNCPYPTLEKDSARLCENTAPNNSKPNPRTV